MISLLSNTYQCDHCENILINFDIEKERTTKSGQKCFDIQNVVLKSGKEMVLCFNCLNTIDEWYEKCKDADSFAINL